MSNTATLLNKCNVSTNSKLETNPVTVQYRPEISFKERITFVVFFFKSYMYKLYDCAILPGIQQCACTCKRSC